MKRLWLPLALTTTLALVGCGGGADGSDTRAGSGTSAGAAANSAPALPAGHVWQTVEAAGLKFAIPETWSGVNPKKALAAGDTSAFDDMGERMGVSADQLKQAMGNAEILLMAPPKEGYADNVTGIMATVDALPTQAQLTAQLGAVTDGDVVVTPGTSAAGKYIGAAYTIPVQTKEIHGRSLFFEGKGGILNLAVSALEDAQAVVVSKVIIDTIHKA